MVEGFSKVFNGFLKIKVWKMTEAKPLCGVRVGLAPPFRELGVSRPARRNAAPAWLPNIHASPAVSDTERARNIEELESSLGRGGAINLAWFPKTPQAAQHIASYTLPSEPPPVRTGLHHQSMVSPALGAGG